MENIYMNFEIDFDTSNTYDELYICIYNDNIYIYIYIYCHYIYIYKYML